MAGNVTGAEVVAQAQTWLGVPYLLLYGGTTRRGTDCSGLVMQVFAALGITVPRTSEEQWAYCKHIPSGQEMTGDLMFVVGSELDPSPGHVALVVNPGNPDKVIDAPYTGSYVRYDNFSRNGTGVNQLVGYGRVPGVSPSSSASTTSSTSLEENTTGSILGGVIASAWLLFLVFIVIVAAIIIFAAKSVIGS